MIGYSWGKLTYNKKDIESEWDKLEIFCYPW